MKIPSTIRYDLKPLVFKASSRQALQKFPKRSRSLGGMELFRIQTGTLPTDWKPMPTIGPGACEIRIHEPNEHRIIYVAKFPEAIYVIHAFEKKSQSTPQKEIDLARKNYVNLQKDRQSKT